METGTLDLLGACKQENTTLAGALAAAFLKAASNMKEIKEQKKDEFNFTRWSCSSLSTYTCHNVSLISSLKHMSLHYFLHRLK
jgi:hypothetical protein